MGQRLSATAGFRGAGFRVRSGVPRFRVLWVPSAGCRVLFHGWLNNLEALLKRTKTDPAGPEPGLYEMEPGRAGSRLVDWNRADSRRFLMIVITAILARGLLFDAAENEPQ
jgi:hypothetical protein